MCDQSKAYPRLSTTPFQVYAPLAIAATQASQVQLVLRERIAERLATVLRSYTGKPLVPLAALTPRERNWCLSEAAVLVAVAESIHGEAPPTAGELRRVERRLQLDTVRRRVRCAAVRLGHDLGPFRQTVLPAGYEDASCLRCSGTVTINRTSLVPTLSDRLQASCADGRA